MKEVGAEAKTSLPSIGSVRVIEVIFCFSCNREDGCRNQNPTQYGSTQSDADNRSTVR